MIYVEVTPVGARHSTLRERNRSCLGAACFVQLGAIESTVVAVQIPASELSRLPYLRVTELGGRQLGLTPFWDGSEWHSWIPRPDGTLFPMRPRDVGEGTYVATEAAAAVDLHFPFVEFVWKHASWPDVMHWYRALLEDVHQVATSVAKVDFFWSTRDRLSALGVRASSSVSWSTYS